jgi:hypothetical protein
MTLHHGHHHHGHGWGAPACERCQVCEIDEAAWALGSLAVAPVRILAALVGWLARRPQLVAGLAIAGLVALAGVAVVHRGVLDGREIAGHLAAAGITWVITRVWRAARRSTRDQGPHAALDRERGS